MDEHIVLWDLDTYSEEFIEAIDEEDPEYAGFMRGYMNY